jgi:MATE family multidrug resistance protein
VFVGQLSVVAFATVDTVLLGRHSAADLAALAVGAAAYITIFIGLMGVVLALGPIVGQLYGARQLAQAGRSCTRPCGWRWACRLLGSTLLLFPAPFMALARMVPEQEARVRDYLRRAGAVAAGVAAVLRPTAASTTRCRGPRR